jgi:hypothetical protein
LYRRDPFCDVAFSMSELPASFVRRSGPGTVKRWLEMAVKEEDGKGNKQPSTVNKDKSRGTPQAQGAHAPGHTLHQFMVRDRVEVTAQVKGQQ